MVTFFFFLKKNWMVTLHHTSMSNFMLMASSSDICLFNLIVKYFVSSLSHFKHLISVTHVF